MEVDQTPRIASFCSDVVASGHVLAVADARVDDRCRHNPLATGPPEVRSYLGVLLIGRDGLPLARYASWTGAPVRSHPGEVEVLMTLAEQVMFLLGQRRRDLLDGLLGEEVLAEARDPARILAALQAGELIPHFQLLVGIEHALVVPVGRAVLDAALGQLIQLEDDGIRLPGGVAVNVASGQLAPLGLARDVLAALTRHGVRGSQLTLKITGATALDDVVIARSELSAIVAMGVHVVVDDYGGGWGSFTRILQLPVDAPQIDRGIGAHVLDDPRAVAMVASTVTLARSLGLSITAEGVASREVRDHLASAGGTLAQGWLYGVALSGPAVISALRRGRRGSRPAGTLTSAAGPRLTTPLALVWGHGA